MSGLSFEDSEQLVRHNDVIMHGLASRDDAEGIHTGGEVRGRDRCSAVDARLHAHHAVTKGVGDDYLCGLSEGFADRNADHIVSGVRLHAVDTDDKPTTSMESSGLFAASECTVKTVFAV
jgi:hypothetical protein